MTARVSLSEYRQLHLFRGPRQRGRRPPAAPEFRTQCALADLLRRCADPEWFWTAFPAGEYRTAATGARLKRMGLKRGVSDFVFISPGGEFCGLELKRRGGRQSEAQVAFEAWCLAHGVTYAVADSYEAAVAILVSWGVLKSKEASHDHVISR
jgi:hypothetical protein